MKNWRTASRKRYFVAALLILCLLAGCGSLGPKVTLPVNEQAPIYVPPTLASSALATPTADLTLAANTNGEICTDELTYLGDISIPDGTTVEPGSTLDKQWDIKNSGSCDWDESYSVRLIEGPDLGATTPQAITPLRADVEGVIRIIFTAPQEPGNYISKWQAYGPNGEPFGQFFSIEINVIEN
jgi:hypothetical protein